MSSPMHERMRSNPKFQELVGKRGRFAWTLAAVVLILFYGFVLTVAFKPSVLVQPISEGSFVTVGVVAGLFQFVFFWSLTALYVRRANREFDELTKQVIDEALAIDSPVSGKTRAAS